MFDQLQLMLRCCQPCLGLAVDCRGGVCGNLGCHLVSTGLQCRRLGPQLRVSCLPVPQQPTTAVHNNSSPTATHSRDSRRFGVLQMNGTTSLHQQHGTCLPGTRDVADGKNSRQSSFWHCSSAIQTVLISLGNGQLIRSLLIMPAGAQLIYCCRLPTHISSRHLRLELLCPPLPVCIQVLQLRKPGAQAGQAPACVACNCTASVAVPSSGTANFWLTDRSSKTVNKCDF